MEKVFLMNKVQDFVDDLQKSGGRPLYELTPQEARSVLSEVQKAGAAMPAVKIEDIEVETNSGRKMPVKIVSPKGNRKVLPLVFYIHGGGWVMGDDKTHARLVAELAAKIPAVVAFPVYTPSPEAQFPDTTDDLFAVLQYIAAYADKYGADASRLTVAGDSVGGNMAIAMTLMAKANGNQPEIKTQALFYPVTDAAFETESYLEFADGPWLTKKAMEWFWQQYAPNEQDREDILASPLRAEPSALKGLPPALVITDENDVLRDEGEAFARKLNEAGVAVVSLRFAGTIHDFMMLNALADSAPSKAAVLMAAAYLWQRLEDEPAEK